MAMASRGPRVVENFLGKKRSNAELDIHMWPTTRRPIGWPFDPWSINVQPFVHIHLGSVQGPGHNGSILRVLGTDVITKYSGSVGRSRALCGRLVQVLFAASQDIPSLTSENRTDT